MGKVGTVVLAVYGTTWRVLVVLILCVAFLLLLTSVYFTTLISVLWHALEAVFSFVITNMMFVLLVFWALHHCMVNVPSAQIALWRRSFPSERISYVGCGWHTWIPFVRGPLYDARGDLLSFPANHSGTLHYEKVVRGRVDTGKSGDAELHAFVTYRIADVDRLAKYVLKNLHKAVKVGSGEFVKQTVMAGTERLFSEDLHFGDDFDRHVRSCLRRKCADNVYDTGLEITKVQVVEIEGKVDILAATRSRRHAN